MKRKPVKRVRVVAFEFDEKRRVNFISDDDTRWAFGPDGELQQIQAQPAPAKGAPVVGLSTRRRH